MQSKYTCKTMQLIHLKQSFYFIVHHLSCGWPDLIQFEERQTSVNIFFMKYSDSDLSQQTSHTLVINRWTLVVLVQLVKALTLQTTRTTFFQEALGSLVVYQVTG